ncbi:hypothetical protein Q7285_03020 [Glaesserella parasuis]|uniref:Lipoprotein n=1 Tax=Glaesserella parasuis TaxID=738 RepID=A0AA42EIQ8_GLAPU|nr:hypothetical protein [Glaesserella parasuis]MCT8726581.1 hypothetical protein [Glaesserella parasuis]MDD2168231.1 hypothetical protein [Glaesserella parasuis]MDE3996379.1 hypothetical protein [Glaesserella parasuis]MDE4013973.1 hypothetical protein [Glaesserella parasuis]
MKKLFSAVAISFVLSGCFSSVNLPNVNTYPTQAQINSNSTKEKEKIHPISEFANKFMFPLVCPSHFPKNSKQYNNWVSLRNEMISFASSEKSYDLGILEHLLISSRMIAAYTKKNNIPAIASTEELQRLYAQAMQDPKLKMAIEEAAKEEWSKAKCSNPTKAIQDFRAFVKRTAQK